MFDTRLNFNPGNYQPAIHAALVEMQAANILLRLWGHDHTVWKPDPTEISNRLGWLRIAEAMQGELERLAAFRAQIADAGYTHVLLLGMGGSSLAPEVFSKTFGSTHPGLSLAVLDSTDPGAVLHYARSLAPATTLYIVSTKSGGTVETFSFFKYFYNHVAATLGAEKAGEHFAAITDPGSTLAEIAAQHHFRATFLNDPHIGGRFSALSFFGLVPAALVGVDVGRLLQRALQMAVDCGAQVPAAQNPAALLGVTLGELAKAGRDKVTFALSPAITSFGDWVEQLIAESSGKEGAGILPVVGEPLGSPAVYGDDRLFVYLHLKDEPGAPPALQALAQAGHPVLWLQLEDIYDLGGQFFLWELATAIACQRLQINPFDQPNVESAKILARKLVATYQQTGALPEAAAVPLNRESLAGLLQGCAPGSYLALQAYVPPSAAAEALLQALRLSLRDAYQLATTLGYGPRFLHSTGQLHKGDGGRGLFIQITSAAAEDAPIPDEAGNPQSGMSFQTLKMAQALGDGEALRVGGRRVIRFHIEGIDELQALL
jgi:glucose-6-phosphate isomerase